jgi:hypothetical protein
MSLEEMDQVPEEYEGTAAAMAARPLPSVKDPKLWLLKCDV